MTGGQARARVAARDRESGNAPLERVILAPVIVALIGLIIAAGRTTIAQGSVDAAARDAARQASLQRSPSQAEAAGVASADAALAKDGLNCQPTVIMGLRGFGKPLGQPASVRAFVTCTVSLSNLSVPGMPGQKTLRAHFTSPLDPYRGRSLGLGPAGPAGPAAGLASGRA
jgi:Flp pilus assembly protein TadG